MANIRLLEKNVAELIAAGEVVERPASVIKEMCENSIDAGASRLAVEIRNGGVTFMRVSDNGCGIFPEDVPTAFLRHATSKIKDENDLGAIATLGFRGEALAAVSSVARVEMLTKPHELDVGTRYVIEGGEEQLIEEAGCADGTVITVCDLFYNTPARMKFLKKDVSEGNAVAAVVDRIALSHPELSVKLIRDGKTVLNTSGNGRLYDAVYAVCGREFASSMIEFDTASEGIGVRGLTCKPFACKPTKNGQYVFLNGRFVKSGTVAAALEQAYKHSAMVGKYPSAVIHLTVPYGAVDVNVHPAKTEVRFSDEKRIFDAVYGAVKNALAAGDERPDMTLPVRKNNAFVNMTADEYRQTTMISGDKPEPTPARPAGSHIIRTEPPVQQAGKSRLEIQRETEKAIKAYSEFAARAIKEAEEKLPAARRRDEISVSELDEAPRTEEHITDKISVIRCIGEAFATYIIAEKDGDLYFIDKHAAHERLLYECLKKDAAASKQYLLSGVSAVLGKDDYNAVVCALDELNEMGFEVEDFGSGTVIVRAVPSMLVNEDISSMMCEIGESLRTSGKAAIERMDDIYHRIACRAAVKAGNRTTDIEAAQLAERILSSDDIMYCPHGRPVAIRLTKRELEKQFGRIQ